MGSKIIEIFNKIAYNVLSALYQPFWAAVLLAFLIMFLYLYGKEHGWKKNNFIRNMLGTWWRAFKSSSNFRRTFVLAFYTAMILLRTVLDREICYLFHFLFYYYGPFKKNYLMNLRILDLEKPFGKPQKL